MGVVFGFIFFSLILSDSLLSVQGTVYSSPETALKFSQCLIEKMGETQIFSDDDRNDMVEVANVMSEGLLNHQSRLPPRILLTAFLTSMADVIAHGDVVKNASRKSFYYAALEQCSLSTIGYIDNEFIELALGILSSVENMKFSRFGSLQSAGVPNTFEKTVNVEEPVVFNPSAVQPSPVQNPHVAGSFDPYVPGSFDQRVPGNFDPHVPGSFDQRVPGNFDPHVPTTFDPFVPVNFDADETNFKPIVDSYPIATNPLSNVQLASNIGISSAADSKSVSHQEESALAAMASSASYSKTPEVVSSFGGLNVPQTKESTVVVIPPAESKQPVQNYPLPQQPIEAGDVILDPTNMDNVPPLPRGTDDKIPFSSFPLADVQDQDAPSTSSSDDIIFNTLVESSTFKNTFNFNTPQEYAISLASSITEKSLEGYNSEIINEALTAVSDEIARISFHTPENYAHAFSDALIRVLQLHNFPLYDDGSKIAKTLVANLEGTKEFSPQIDFDYPFGVHSDDVVDTDWNTKEVDFDFETPPLAPEDTEGELFSEALAQQLSKSSELTKFFCNTDDPENKMKIYFGIIKSSLVEYSHHVSSVAASIASGALSELSEEELCSNFAKAISEVIAEIFDENGVLQSANAESIAKQMEFNLIQLNVSPVPRKTESSAANVAHNKTIDVIPTLQSSFPTNFDNVNPAPSNLDQSSVDYVSYEGKTYGMSDNFPSENYESDTTLSSFTASSIPIQTSPKSDLEENIYTSPITTLFTTEITDEEFTSSTTLVEFSTSVTLATPTERSLDWAPSGVIDQEELTSYLLDELETALEAYYKEDNNPKFSSNPTDGDLSADEVGKHTDSSDGLKPVTLQSDKNTQNGDKTQPITNENRRNSYLQSEADVLPETKSLFPDSVSEDSGKKTQSKDLTKEKRSSLLTEKFSVKKDLLELQPSFLDPQTAEYPIRKVNPSNSAYGIASDDSITVAAKAMSQIATSSIAYIHSGNFDINNLCARINEFAPFVNVPPLYYCEETAALDYLLNVLNSVLKKLMMV